MNHEAHLSTQRAQAQAPPRVPCPHADEVRPGDHQRPSFPGTRSPERLSALPAPGGADFPKHYRLLQRRQFESVFRQGSRCGDASFGIFATRNGLAYPRLGIAVPRRVSPRAVQRNRIKRQVRESFRHHRDDIAGLDVVVVARHGSAGENNEQLRRSLARQWRVIARKCL